MKIAFVILTNRDLPEPYKEFSEDHLFIATDKGYLYPVGGEKPIDYFDPTILSKLAELSKAPMTVIDTDLKFESKEEYENEKFLVALKEEKELLKAILNLRYASIKQLQIQLDLERDIVITKLHYLSRLNIVYKYASYWKISEEVIPLLETVLQKGDVK